MLEVFVKYLCFVMLTLTGCIVINKILNKKPEKIKLSDIIVMLILPIIPTIMHHTEYNSLNTIIILFINIMIYKRIYKLNIIDTSVLTTFVMIISFVADLITLITCSKLIYVDDMRTVWYSMLITNTVSCLCSILIINIKGVALGLNKVATQINNNKYIRIVLFTLLSFFVFCIVSKGIYHGFLTSEGLINSFLITIIFIILLIIYIQEKNSHTILSKEYETLFNYIHNFEEWIEKEQFNRHEYKNQLAVLRCLSTEKKVKDKIDEMLEDNINLEGKVIHELKMLPKGGIKGLMYYKSAIAQKNKIDLTVNVSIELKSLLNKLTDEDIKTICKLIGIYYDNAIEAASETRKKIMLVEVYELKDKVSFVFSNTFKMHKNFDSRNKKGVSSKGEGHGNGLYYASKLLEKNQWLESKQEVIDKYYIQQLIVHKKKKTS